MERPLQHNGHMEQEPRDLTASSAVERSVADLRQLIVSNQWAHGTRLPPERALATRFGVSRNTIREALSVLSQARLVEIRRGAGAFVTNAEPTLILDSVSTMIEISSIETLLDLLSLRRIVDSEAASLAAVRITAEQLTQLRACLDSMDDAGGSRDAGDPSDSQAGFAAASDQAFHQIVTTASGNHAFGLLTAAINGDTFRQRTRGEDAFPLDTGTAHESIIAALADRDPSRAASAAAAHVADIEMALRAVALRHAQGTL